MVVTVLSVIVSASECKMPTEGNIAFQKLECLIVRDDNGSRGQSRQNCTLTFDQRRRRRDIITSTMAPAEMASRRLCSVLSCRLRAVEERDDRWPVDLVGLLCLWMLEDVMWCEMLLKRRRARRWRGGEGIKGSLS